MRVIKLNNEDLQFCGKMMVDYSASCVHNFRIFSRLTNLTIDQSAQTCSPFRDFWRLRVLIWTPTSLDSQSASS